MIDVEKALYTPTYMVPAANKYLVPNQLIDFVNRTGYDVSDWTRSSWSSATGALSAGWARSSWSCAGCSLSSLGGAIDPQRSSWSKSTWSSAGEDASAEAAQYAQPAEEAEETGSLDAPIPTDDATVPTDDAGATAPTDAEVTQ
jgi:serine protease AprX